MPAHKKKTTISTSPEATSTITPTEPLKAETFQQYLRAEIRHATRAVMEEIMREELSHFLVIVQNCSLTFLMQVSICCSLILHMALTMNVNIER